jgi:hypothetical protein
MKIPRPLAAGRFIPKTNITFSIPEAGDTSLKIYDLLGNEIATLLIAFMAAGTYSVGLDASRYSSGVYVCEMRTNNVIQRMKMILAK